MKRADIRDVPCGPCTRGYGDRHVCEAPDYCACDHTDLHVTDHPTPPPTGQADGPRCDLCGKTDCPDADLAEFSEPVACPYRPVYEALRYDRCEYGCGRDITKATIRRDVIPALAPLVAAEVAAAEVRALREAADAWTQGEWSDVMLPKPTPPAVPVIAYSNRMGDWLRARADDLEDSAGGGGSGIKEPVERCTPPSADQLTQGARADG